MSGYIISARAREELESILDYIAKEDGEDRAIAMYDKFFRAFDLLAHSPRAGFQKLHRTPPNIRSWSVVPFVVLYDCETNPLQIERVLHTARNLPDVLD
jgi:plasmid stabilization system protein ParE